MQPAVFLGSTTFATRCRSRRARGSIRWSTPHPRARSGMRSSSSQPSAPCSASRPRSTSWRLRRRPGAGI